MIEFFERIDNLPIFHFKISDKLLEKIVEDVENSLENNIDVGKTLVGSIYNGSEVLLNTENNLLENLGYEFLKNTQVQDFQNIKLFVSESWVVLQKENDYNPLHVHSSFLSGILYIEIPKFIGVPKDQRVSTSKKNEDGYLVFLNGYSFLTMKPVVGEGYIFASNMPHMVYPFTEKGNRISISWNLDADLLNQITYR
jgi:hypothetical protein